MKPSSTRTPVEDIIFDTPPAAPADGRPSWPPPPPQKIPPVVLVGLLVALFLAWPVLSYVTTTFFTWATDVSGAARFLHQETQNKERAQRLLETNAYPELTSLRRRGPLSRELRDAILPMSYSDQVRFFEQWFALGSYFAALGVERKNSGWSSSRLSDVMLLLHYCPDAFPPQAELDLLPLAKPLQTATGQRISHERDLQQLVEKPSLPELLDWPKKINSSLARMR